MNEFYVKENNLLYNSLSKGKYKNWRAEKYA